MVIDSINIEIFDELVATGRVHSEQRSESGGDVDQAVFSYRPVRELVGDCLLVCRQVGPAAVRKIRHQLFTN